MKASCPVGVTSAAAASRNAAGDSCAAAAASGAAARRASSLRQCEPGPVGGEPSRPGRAGRVGRDAPGGAGGEQPAERGLVGGAEAVAAEQADLGAQLAGERDGDVARGRVAGDELGVDAGRRVGRRRASSLKVRRAAGLRPIRPTRSAACS